MTTPLPYVIRSLMGSRSWYWSAREGRNNRPGASMWSQNPSLIRTYDTPEQARLAISEINNPCRCEIVQVDQDEMDCIQEARARVNHRANKWRKYQMVEVEE